MIMYSTEIREIYLDLHCEKIPEMVIAYVYENTDGSFSTIFVKDPTRKAKSRFVQNLDEIKRVKNLRKDFFSKNPEHCDLFENWVDTHYKQKILEECDKIRKIIEDDKLSSYDLWSIYDNIRDLYTNTN